MLIKLQLSSRFFQVQDSESRQEQLIQEIQSNHEKFVSETGGGGANARDDMFKSLAAAHDNFFELRGNLQEGTKFYNDLTQLLITFQNKVTRKMWKLLSNNRFLTS